jgi:hypothetical protein
LQHCFCWTLLFPRCTMPSVCSSSNNVGFIFLYVEKMLVFFVASSFKNVGMEEVAGGWVKWCCRLLKGSIVMSHLLCDKIFGYTIYETWILLNLVVCFIFTNLILFRI